MSQKIYLFILKTGIIAGFISFFLVSKNLLFPFITSKQIFFDILIEVLLVVWLAFIVKYPQWNPFKKKNKNLITWGIIGFFGALVISLLGTIDFNMSFWGDIERMLGIFHLLHFLVFYFIIITVMRDRKDWKMLLIASVIACALVAIEGIRPNSTHPRISYIGNAAYVAGLMIFGIYFSIMLFIREKTVWKWAYIPAILVMILSFKRASISGAYVGLGFSAICFFFLMGILFKNKKVKIATLVIFVLLSAITWLAFTNKDHPWVAEIKPIQEISINKNTFQTRLISWRGALADFKGHWLLGVGHGNYSEIFDKHFTPDFFDYTRVETYFDRAHNNVIDIASTTGVVGISTYLLIFVFLGIYLIRAYRAGRLNSLEFTLISCLLIAYFVQNLAVFDSLVTYVAFMILLGYIHFLTNTKEEKGNTQSLISEKPDRGLINPEIYTLFGAGLVMFLVIWNYNILPTKMLQKTIDGQRAFGARNFALAIDEYREALKYDTPLDRDSRFTLVRSAIQNYYMMQSMSQEERNEDIEYVIEQAEINVELSPFDTLLQMQLARSTDMAARYHSDPVKRQEYSQLALEAINKSIEASPGRIPVYFIKSQILLNTGQRDEAIEVLKYAASLNDNYFESQCQLSQTYLMPKEVSEEEEALGMEALKICLDNKGHGFLVAPNAIKRGINHYAGLSELNIVIKLYEQLVRYEPKVSQNWINLVKLYNTVGKYDKAISSAKKAAEADPSLKSDVDEFIKEIERKKAEEAGE